MPSMSVPYTLVILVMGVVCILLGIALVIRQKLKVRSYTAVVTGKLTGYEDVYETTKEGTTTTSERIYYPIFVYEVDGVAYKKSTSKQFHEADERPTDVDVPIRYNPKLPSDCYIPYQEYPLLTPILILVVGVIAAVWGLVAIA